MSSVLASGRIGGRLGRLAHATLSSLLLGLLSEEQLRALDERYYCVADGFRDDSWNERGLWPWEQDAVERHFEPGTRLVVPACGGGREVLALCRSGFDAIGYEPHPRLLSFGQRFLAARGYPHRIRWSERDHFPCAEPCEGVLVGWGAYSLIARRSRRVDFLAAARAALGPGRPLVLSCFERPVRDRELQLLAAAANRLRRLRGAAPVEFGDALAPNRVHLFGREEVVGEITAAGFMPEDVRSIGVDSGGASHLRVIARTR